MRKPLPRLLKRAYALLAAVALVLTALLPAGPAVAAEPAGDQFDLVEALETLVEYGLVRGDQSGSLRLADPITRAEMATILVRAMGYEQQALFLAGAEPFRDVKGHWASGYLAVAKNLGLVAGYPDGRFLPDQNVTYAEAMAMLLRLVKQSPTSGGWPDGVLNQAVAVGIAPPDVPIFAKANAPANRLDVFSSFYLAISRVKDPATGKTVLQNIDPEPPALAVSDVPASTQAEKVTISGTATGASRVTVAGRAVKLGTQGQFTAEVPLELGSNTIEVQAFDRAGNVAVRQVTVERVLPVARIEISGPTEVQAGTKAEYKVKGYDAAGKEVPVPGVQVTLTGSAATLDPATLTLTAGQNPGQVTLKATYHNLTATLAVEVVGLAPEARALRISAPDTLVQGRKYTVQVEVLDANGNLVEKDFGRSVTLAADEKSVAITPTTAATKGGVAQFEVEAKEPGTVTLTASAAGLASAVQTVTVRTSVAVRLEVLKSTVDPGDSTLVRATLVDANDKPVTNSTGKDVEIRLSVSGDADLDTEEIVIPRGKSSSGYAAELTVGWDSRTVVVRGWVVSDHDYTVESVSVRVNADSAGSGQATEIRVGPPGIVEVGKRGLFLIQVLDRNGNPVAADYAFRLKITTSNNEPQIDGIPVDADGKPLLELQFGRASGINPTTTTVRTENGTAFVYVTYYRSGSVTITPVPASGGNNIPDDDGDEGRASSSTGLKMTAGTGYYQGEPVGIRLMVLSPVSKEWSEVGGVVRNSTSETVKLRVEAVDEYGNIVRGTKGTVTLQRVQGSSTEPPKNMTATMTDGVVEFTIRATTKAGTDVYKATFVDATGKWSDDGEVRIAVQDSSSKNLITPVIDYAVGVKGDEEASDRNVIQPTDTAMRIYLVRQPDDLVAVKVFRGSSLIWTSPVIDINTAAPYVDVPRSVLPTSGTHKFRVQVVNAVGTSNSSSEREIKFVGYNSASITGVLVDGKSKKLIVSGQYLNTDGTVDPKKLSIVNLNTGKSVDLSNLDADIAGSKTIELTLTSGDLAELLKPEDFHGHNVYLTAQTGWYVDPNGNLAKADLSGNKVEPLAWVERAELDLDGGRIYLYGKGLSTGSVTVSTVSDTMKVKQPSAGEELPEKELLLKGYVADVDSLADSRIVIYLRPEFKNKFEEQHFSGDLLLIADAGWMTKGQQGKALPFSVALEKD
ncbi:MAG: S-layer homology domain-containing protein [Firmicutes bacterium]|nr:S-layer homology domain-containing protein [Bacillota bacterium]